MESYCLWSLDVYYGHFLFQVSHMALHMILETLNITFTSNGEREFVPRDQMSPYTCRLLLIISTLKLLFHGIFRP